MKKTCQEDMLKVAATARCEYFKSVDRTLGPKPRSERGGKGHDFQTKSDGLKPFLCHVKQTWAF